MRKSVLCTRKLVSLTLMLLMIINVMLGEWKAPDNIKNVRAVDTTNIYCYVQGEIVLDSDYSNWTEATFWGIWVYNEENGNPIIYENGEWYESEVNYGGDGRYRSSKDSSGWRQYSLPVNYKYCFNLEGMSGDVSEDYFSDGGSYYLGYSVSKGWVEGSSKDDVIAKLNGSENGTSFFEIGRDSNNFLHHWTDFGYTSEEAEKCQDYSDDSIGTVYPTSATYYEKLTDKLDWKQEASLLNTMYTGSWGGSCQGLSMSLALARINKFDSSAFDTADKKYYCYNDLPMPANEKDGGLEFRNLINYYHLMQYADKMPKVTNRIYNFNIFGHKIGVSDNIWNNHWNAFYSDVKVAIENEIPLLIDYGYKGRDGKANGHVVLACGLDDSNPNYTIITIYDCNYSTPANAGKYLYLYVSKTNQDFYMSKSNKEIIEYLPSGFGMNNWNYIGYWNMSAVNSIDAGIENKDASVLSLLNVSNTSDINSTTVFQVSAFEEFKLENNIGQYLAFNSEGITGDMEIYDFDIVGEEEQIFKFTIDSNEYFKITNYSDDCQCSLYVGDNYYTVNATGVDTVSFSENNGIEFEGENYTFSAGMSVLASDSLIYLNGSCTTDSEINYLNNGIALTTEGEYAASRIEVINTDGINVEEINDSFHHVELDEYGKIVNVESSDSEKILGDVNNDGKIDLKDYALLLRYVAGWDVEINTVNADVNKDGAINLKDYVLIQRYVAGWDVELK